MDHFRRTAALGAMGLLVSTYATAQGQPPADTAADWLTKPTDEQVQAYYPDAAATSAASGLARIRCTATIDTTLRNCSVISESPAGLGFGDAAVAMSALFRMKPATKSGQPVDSEVSIPLSFTLPARAVTKPASLITNPDWRKMPSPAEMSASWPPAAAAAGQDGKVSLRCAVTVDGLVTNCGVISETPAGLGFGGAALSLAPLFRMKPLTKDGVPVGGATVVIPIAFKCDGCGGPHVAFDTVKLYRSIPWLQAPTLAQMAEAYPAKARKDQMQSGLISLRCEFGAEGELKGCKSAAESPTGEGLDGAARKLARYFKAPLKDIKGDPMRGSQVLVSFAFAPRLLDDPASAMGRPQIVETLSPGDTAALFPAKAKAANVRSGQAVLTCMVGEAGSLANCAVKSEAPANMDFGAAAQEIAAHSRAGLWSDGGLPTLGATMTLRFPMAAP